MSRNITLVTGAGGEFGRLLVPALAENGDDVIALDLDPLPAELVPHCHHAERLDVTDRAAMASLVERWQPRRVFHLAALLSGHAERDPDRAHRVNVEATLDLYRISSAMDHPVRFVLPSSIAVYGLPDAATKQAAGAIAEHQWTTPAGIYGCHKLYCELVGSYLARRTQGHLDFRAIRFPGLISAETLPSGGTTDYGPVMIHAAARAERATCFVSAETRLPFMTMPDAVQATLRLADAEASTLSTRVYNIRGFSCSAEEIFAEVRRHFRDAEIEYVPDPVKQAIADSWPADVDDSAARRDWGLATEHGLAEALRDYLVPSLRRLYAESSALRDQA